MRLSLFILSLTIFASCADKKEEWLKSYAQTKCAYSRETENIKADSVKTIAPLINEKTQLQDQLQKITAPFEERIKGFNEGLKEAQRDYMKEYRKAEEAQSERYGHRNTPAYEKKLSSLENIKATKISALQNKIAKVKEEMEANSDFKNLNEKIKLLEDKINSSLTVISEKHKPTIDSLQELLNTENSNFKRMQSEMETVEKKQFELKRDSIRVNPCN